MGILSAPPLLRRIEWGTLLLGLVATAFWQSDALTRWFWFWLLAPDLFGLLPASLMGAAPQRGVLPTRGVWLYNTTHALVIPLAAWVVGLGVFAQPLWPLLGWLIHIAADRTVGYGFRTADGYRTAP